MNNDVDSWRVEQHNIKNELVLLLGFKQKRSAEWKQADERERERDFPPV